MPNNVIVVGMPRSGTSMLAGIFGRLGFYVAEDAEQDLRSGDLGNPDGYWEAEGLIEKNVEVFAAAGFPHHNTWLFDPITPEQAAHIGAIGELPGHRAFVDEYEAHAPWVWKDPRLCYTLPYWWPLVDPSSTRVVLIRRDPEATLRSFLRLGWRDGGPGDREDVLQRIEDHVAAAQKAVTELNIPHVTVSYDAFKDDGPEIARKLSRLVEADITAEDLGFEKGYDHSAGRGRATFLLERLGYLMPSGARRLVRAVVPRPLLRKLFPGID